VQTVPVPLDAVGANSHYNHTNSSLLPIQWVPSYQTSRLLTIFFDSGSNASFITHKAAKLCHAKRLKSVQLDLTTTGNIESHHDTCTYEVRLKGQDGSAVVVSAYGLPEITGNIGKLDEEIITKLFPSVNVQKIKRGSYVDLLIGSDYCSLHPRREIANIPSYFRQTIGTYHYR
jgi:hypothetical protein